MIVRRKTRKITFGDQKHGYVSIGGDPRSFSGGIPFVGGATNVSFSRVAFGIGAVICWLATFAFAVSGARKLLDHGRS